MTCRVLAFMRMDSALYTRYFDSVYGYLAVILQDHHAAEDVTQRVFVRALEKAQQFERRADASFRAWLLGIARHEALNHRRKERRVEVLDPDVLGRHVERTGAQSLEHSSDSDIARVVARLPLLQRQVIALHYQVGLPLVEIAVLMNRSPESVRQLHRRALLMLERRLSARRFRSGRVSRAASRLFDRESGVVRTRRLALAGRCL
jgi:RNA polymerase sigma-70 factor, ECF subfamily